MQQAATYKMALGNSCSLADSRYTGLALRLGPLLSADNSKAIQPKAVYWLLGTPLSIKNSLTLYFLLKS